jgi:hypothetical protein
MGLLRLDTIRVQSRNLDRSKHGLDSIESDCLHINHPGPDRFNCLHTYQQDNAGADKRNMPSISDSPLLAGHETELPVGKEI